MISSLIVRTAAAVGIPGGIGFMASARAATQLALGSVSAGPGEMADVPLTFQSDADPVAAQVDIHYDAERLVPGFANSGSPGAFPTVISAVLSPGVVRVVLYSIENFPLPDGRVAVMPFRVLQGAPEGPSEITVSQAIVADESATRLTPVNTASGAVIVRADRAPMLQMPVVSASGQVVLTVEGTAGLTYTIQVSSDLVQWTDLASGVAADGILTHADTLAPGQSPRFYRAFRVP